MNNPFGQIIGIVDCEKQIIGHMAWVPTIMKVGNRIILGSQAVDLVVHPKFRRHGIFLEIGRFLAKEAEKRCNEVTYGFPNYSAHSGHLKYGWFDVCQVPLLVKPLNLRKADSFRSNFFVSLLTRNRLLNRFMTVALRIGLKSFSFFSAILNRVEESDNSTNHTIRAIHSFDNRFDDFWEAVSGDYPIIVCRNRKFLTWRYSKNPKARYTVLVAEENEKVLGYIVLRTEKEKRLGYVVDILSYLDKKTVIRSLITKASAHFEEENVDLVLCWMLKNGASANVYYKILNAQGFIHLPGRSNPLIARLNQPNLSEEHVKNPSNWYVTMGDSDHV
jgi:GNAT superfamily N-acetyltransferase